MACPTCKRKTLFFCQHTPWHGWGLTCLRCGERWDDVEMLERPFCPSWRRDNIRSARKRYRAIGLIPGEVHEVGEFDIPSGG